MIGPKTRSRRTLPVGEFGVAGEKDGAGGVGVDCGSEYAQ